MGIFGEFPHYGRFLYYDRCLFRRGVFPPMFCRCIACGGAKSYESTSTPALFTAVSLHRVRAASPSAFGISAPELESPFLLSKFAPRLASRANSKWPDLGMGCAAPSPPPDIRKSYRPAPRAARKRRANLSPRRLTRSKWVFFAGRRMGVFGEFYHYGRFRYYGRCLFWRAYFRL